MGQSTRISKWIHFANKPTPKGTQIKELTEGPDWQIFKEITASSQQVTEGRMGLKKNKKKSICPHLLFNPSNSIEKINREMV